jgi:hypothetical protein
MFLWHHRCVTILSSVQQLAAFSPVALNALVGEAWLLVRQAFICKTFGDSFSLSFGEGWGEAVIVYVYTALSVTTPRTFLPSIVTFTQNLFDNFPNFVCRTFYFN